MNTHAFAARIRGSAVAMGLLVAPAAAGPVEAIFTNLPGHPTSAAPGLAGLAFNPGISTQFDRPFVSPSGQRWILRARLGPPATNADNEVILVGSGRTGAVALREGSPTGFLPGESFGSIQGTMGINDLGQFAFACVTASSPASNVVVRWSGTGYQLVAREGTPAPGTGGGLYSGLLDSVGILADGVAYFRAGGIVQGARAGQTILYRGTQIVAATGDPEFEPLDQLNDPQAPWASFTANRFRMDATGQNWLAFGDLQAPVSAQAMAVNNRVRTQQFTVIPGDPLGRIVDSVLAPAPGFLSPHGRRWLLRGRFANGQDFVMQGGRIIATTGEPITLRPDEQEAFDGTLFPRTFFVSVGNSVGDIVIGGVTNTPAVDANATLVLNRQRVIVREGDPVDLSGTGVPSGDAFIGAFNDDNAVFTDDGWLYFTANIRNAAGALTGQGFLRVKVCKPDWNGSGAIDSSDISAFLSDWLSGVGTGSLLADYNNDGVVNSSDVSGFLTAWLAAAAGGC